jgi:hypothetical protein
MFWDRHAWASRSIRYNLDVSSVMPGFGVQTVPKSDTGRPNPSLTIIGDGDVS